MEPFKQKADTGRLMASESKRTQLSPDYYGEIAINLKDMANVEVVDGLHIFKLSGWKKQSKAGKTYLSVSVKRKVADSAAKPQPAAKSSGFDDMDDDIPF
jgi:hypothetical protein